MHAQMHRDGFCQVRETNQPTSEVMELDTFEEKEGSHFFGFTYSKVSVYCCCCLPIDSKKVSAVLRSHLTLTIAFYQQSRSRQAPD